MSQRGHGAEPPAAGQFFVIFWEKNYFDAIRITIRTFSEPFERTKFLMFESQLKKSLPLLQVKSKTRLKSCIFGFKFCDLVQVREIKVHCFLQHF